MRPILTPLSLSLLALTMPFGCLAAEAAQDLTPAQVEEQQLDTECRAILEPYGQGDLEGALLHNLRHCIIEKRTAKRIEIEQAQERERLSLRDQREAARRATILSRSRKGTEMRIRNANALRIEQGTLLQRLKTKSRYEKIHRTLRGVEVPSATAD